MTANGLVWFGGAMIGRLMRWLVVCVLVLPAPVRAACDVIPQATTEFRGTRGSLDRPFAGAGDVVSVQVNPACTGSGMPGLEATASAHAVVVAFRPPAPTAPGTVVVLSSRCTDLPVALDACGVIAPGTRCCQRVSAADDDPAPLSPGLDVVERDGRRRLRFRFPDTDASVAGPNDARGLTGPAAVAVVPRADGAAFASALRLADRTGTCADVLGAVACVDTLFANDGTCAPTQPDATFSHFTALPPSNSFASVCTGSPSCRGGAAEVRFTTDAAGNVLVPMDWEDLLVGDRGVAVPLLLRVSASVPATTSAPESLRIPDRRLLASFDVRGARLSPIFDPRVDTADASRLVLFGTADAARSVLRIGRNACGGGTASGTPCTDDGDCPGGACAPLFDFSDRFLDGVGPVLVSTTPSDAGQVNAVALDPVPFDGLVQTEGIDAFVSSERLARKALNGDLDQTDHVIGLAARASGAPRPIGRRNAAGKAIMRVNSPFTLTVPAGTVRVPFSPPALAAEDDLVAFLESEPGEYDERDAAAVNDVFPNGRIVDGVLRVYRVEDTAAVEVTGDTATIAVDAAPRINGQSVVLSAGRVFYRRSEAGQARRTTQRASVRPQGKQLEDGASEPAISGDGRFVSFSSFTHLFGPGGNGPDFGVPDFFLFDRVKRSVELLSGNPRGREGAYVTYTPPRPAWLSFDGRYAVFQAEECVAGYVGGDADCDNDFDNDIFIRDRVRKVTEFAALTAGGGDAAYSERYHMSPDGRHICFLGPGSAEEFEFGVFARDLDTGLTERVDVKSGGERSASDNLALQCAISADGRIVTFESEQEDLVAGDTNEMSDVFVHDRFTSTTSRVSVSSSGAQADNESWFPSLSWDGRYVVFESGASNLVDGDTNGSWDIFVHDRLTHTTTRASVTSDGTEADAGCDTATISGDGRMVGFESGATNLVRDDTNDEYDQFVHDRLTGVTERVTVRTNGAEGEGSDFGDVERYMLALSMDGSAAAFRSGLALVADDTNDTDDVYVRAPAADATSDLFPDGQLDDTVLEVLDTQSSGARVTRLCPAGDVVVAGDTAAFLRPESAIGTPACPGGSLNADGDVTDTVVQLWTATGGVRNLGRAATAVATSEHYVAALLADPVPVVGVYATAASAWRAISPPAVADGVALCGDAVVAFLTPEALHGADLNGDGDVDDRVLRLLDAAASAPVVVNVGQAAEDFRCSGRLLAFRTREASQGHTILNDDGDADDDVLQVFDLTRPDCVRAPSPPAECRASTGSAVRPCDRPGCDPRIPYLVLDHTVRFLTAERDQGRDLSGDDDGDPQAPDALNEVVLQTFNARQAFTAGATASARAAQAVAPTDASTVLGAAPAGVCTSDGSACVDDVDCAGGTCFVPPGGCLRDLGEPCYPSGRGGGGGNPCGVDDQICAPAAAAAGEWTCHLKGRACRTAADCELGDECSTTLAALHSLASPLTAGTAAAAGSVTFTRRAAVSRTSGLVPRRAIAGRVPAAIMVPAASTTASVVARRIARRPPCAPASWSPYPQRTPTVTRFRIRSTIVRRCRTPIRSTPTVTASATSASCVRPFRERVAARRRVPALPVSRFATAPPARAIR